MSVSKPQNRQEFKRHILTKLGAPVLEINISDEQLDIVIDDAFQYFNERNHYNGVERMYLSMNMNDSNLLRNFSSYREYVSSNDSIQDVNRQDIIDPEFAVDGVDRTLYHTARGQRNFIIMPDDVVGVTQIIRNRTGTGIGGGIVPPGMIYPGLIGNLSGQGCDNHGYGLTSYYAFMEYMALLEFTFMPPKMYNFNQRTHRLWIDGDLRDVGSTLICECMVKPNPDIFPDLWNDMFLKEMSTAMAKAQWGRNVTKYSQVQLPGGIVLNGERILNDAYEEIKIIKERFAMDFADPPLDCVG